MELLIFFFSCIFLIAFLLLGLVIHKNSWVFYVLGVMWGFLFCASMTFEDPFTLYDTTSGFLINTDAVMPFIALPALLTIANFIMIINESRG